VLVVGGGNSAVESALSLADAGGCASVAISYRRAQFARCRKTNRERIDAAIAKGSVTAWMESEIDRIDSHAVTLRTPRGVETLANDAVIVQVGGTPPSSVLKTFGIDMVTKYGEA
jgi:thioredoxin reductase